MAESLWTLARWLKGVGIRPGDVEIAIIFKTPELRQKAQQAEGSFGEAAGIGYSCWTSGDLTGKAYPRPQDRRSA